MSYIGQTINIKRRLQCHKSKTSDCTYLRNAIQKYGWENFDVEILWEGDNFVLGEMEKEYIKKYNTITPNGYNLIDAKGVGGKVSETTLKTMINSQRNRYIKKNGALGAIRENKSRVDGRTTSWTVIGCRNGKTYSLANCKSKEEALEIQYKFTKNPDTYQIPPSKRVPNGQSSNVYFCNDIKRRKRWHVQFRVKGKNISLGRYETKEEALEVANKYKENPDKIDEYNKKNKVDVGVTFNTNENTWKSAFWNGKKNIFLGRYNTKEEAIDARKRYIDDPHNFVRPNQRKPIHNT